MGKERWSRKTACPALPIVGFGLLLAWTYVVFFSRLVHFSTRNSIEHLNSTYSFACCGIIAALVFYALPWDRLPLHRDGRRSHGPTPPLNTPVFIGTAVAASLCTVALTFVEHDFFRQPWCSIAATVSGIACAVLFLGWSHRFVHCPGSQSFVWLSLSFVCGAAVFFITLSLPAPAALGVTYCLPVASAIMLNTSGIDDRREHEAKALPSRTMPVFLRMLLSLFLIGLAESLVRALFLEVDPGTQSLAYQTLFLVAMLCAALAVTCASRYRKNPAQALNRVALFVLVVLSLLAPIVMGVGIWGDLPALICYGLFYLFTWATLSQVTRVFKLPARFAFGWGLGMAYAGCLAGTFFGSLLASYVDLSYKGQSLMALACASLVMVALLLVTDDRMLTHLLDTDSERPVTPRRFMLRVEEAAQTHGLTAKETEVLVLAAKGRTTQRICEELGISTGTANTHLAHIYKKFDVHDRQQLIDILENVEQ